MKKNRYLLCLLLSGLLLYYAVPQLTVSSPGVEGVFAYAWLGFALMVIAGNLAGLLYTPKRQINNSRELIRKESMIKSRYFN